MNKWIILFLTLLAQVSAAETILKVVERTILVEGKEAKVFSIVQTENEDGHPDAGSDRSGL